MRANNPLLEQAAGQKESSSKKWGCENTSRDGRFSRASRDDGGLHFSVLTILILSLLVIVLLLHRYMKFLERVADRLSQIDERGRQLKSPSQE
jgi:hypothetical protein